MPYPKLYRAWKHMRNRCYNPNAPRYSDYGGRGIKVCDRWKYFANFLEDMGERPEGYTLDRINNDGDYEPSNCRWASKEEQANNKRNNRMFTIDGITKSLTQWGREYGIKQSTLSQRFYSYKWPIDKALKTPVGVRRIVNWQ